MADTLAQKLARFAANLNYDDLPPAVIDKAKACILHNIGVGLAGHGSSAAAAARAVVLAQESAGAEGASIMVTGERVSTYGAAFVNSALMHAKLMEDAYHTGSHPGVMIVPAALAVAETQAYSGKELITAVVAGYEVEAAITAGFIPNSNDHGFRSSPIYGPFGAAVAAGRLVGLNEEQMAHAIGFAATFAAGTFEGGDGTDVMVLQVSQAPRSGLLAANLAQRNARASDTSLDGPLGFYYAFTGSSDGLEQLADHLGSRWEILEVTLKRYPTSMFNQPPIHTMLSLVERYDIQPDQIDSALIEMNDFETAYPSAKFTAGGAYGRRRDLGATAFVVAAACVNRGFAVPGDRLAGWSSPIEGMDQMSTHWRSTLLAEQITVTGSPAIPPLTPRVTVNLKDGSTVDMQATGNEFKLDLAEDEGIIRTLVPEIQGGSRQVERLITAVRHLPDVSTIDELIAASIES